MSLLAQSVTVAATPTLLTAAQKDIYAGSSLAVKVPAGGATVFIGGPTVTASGAGQGWPLAAGESLFLDIDARSVTSPGLPDTPGEDVYAIVASGTQAVNLLARGI